MLQNILVPERIGNYYLFPQRILSFDISPMMVQGLLIYYNGRNIKIKNKISIILKDFTAQAQSNAIKKIASTIGRFDEVVTTLSSAAVIFKELQLPFLGRDKLEMVVGYEVESMLPFSLDDAVIDFIITQEDTEKKVSTVLVAAARKEDVNAHHMLFEKAEVPLHTVTIDIFALSMLYFQSHYRYKKIIHSQVKKVIESKSIWQKIQGWLRRDKKDEKKQIEIADSSYAYKTKQHDLFVDLGFDVIRVLYMQDGILKAVRVIPHGIFDMAQNLGKEAGLSYYDIAQDIMTNQTLNIQESKIAQEFKKLFEEIARTMLFFEKQENLKYIKPEKIWFSGLGCNLYNFLEVARESLGSFAQIMSIKKVLDHIDVKQSENNLLSIDSLLILATGLSVHYQSQINFLKHLMQRSDNRLLNKQLLAIVFMTVLCIGGLFWGSSSILGQLQQAFNSSKKELVQSIQQRMHIDVRNESSGKGILDKVETAFKAENLLWFSFAKQSESSVLDYLQDLSTHIDRAALKLDLRHMHIDYEKVILVGSIGSGKEFETLELFEEELMSLKLLTLVDKPRELSFTVQLQAKDTQGGSV